MTIFSPVQLAVETHGALADLLCRRRAVSSVFLNERPYLGVEQQQLTKFVTSRRMWTEPYPREALYPPVHFNAVGRGVYRSAIPGELNIEFLQTLNLRTIIILEPELVDDKLLSHLLNCQITPIPIEGATSERGLDGLHMLINEDIVIETLKKLHQKEYLPTLITCRTGKYLTGVVVGCLRKLQRWSLTSILEEYRRLAGFSSSHLHQQCEQFIDLFDAHLFDRNQKGGEAPLMIS